MKIATKTKDGWYKIKCLNRQCEYQTKKKSLGKEWQCPMCGVTYTLELIKKS